MGKRIAVVEWFQPGELQALPVPQPASFCYFGDDAFGTEDLMLQMYEDALARRIDAFDIGE